MAFRSIAHIFFLPSRSGSRPLSTAEGLVAVWNGRVSAEEKKGKPGGAYLMNHWDSDDES